ncbi:hypothetical protein [Prosthecomicrobium pneumaticum]|uniref:Uncharacterized protein n=1 Tax=Prosthecomicrobium pneumaticum TaxID=81895 RepID=A0A7W9FMI2_9HYPH|nr:hypothetical protein [Prosthecomicrobium pneumaticum]MBB5753390.1 hypothetical protein [Prosthecomicrobium pneumaticum]
MSTMLAAATAAALALCAVPAFAEDAERPAPPRVGRFTMIPADQGFVRLDTETGIVSHCRRAADMGSDPAAAGPWRCSIVEDEAGAAPDPAEADAIAALSREVAALAARVAALERAAAAAPPGEPQAARPVDPPPVPPRAAPDPQADDRSLDLAEEMMRRFFDMVRTMKREGEADHI